jgi:hypothetical protein
MCQKKITWFKKRRHVHPLLSSGSSGTWFRATYISSPTTWISASGFSKSTFYGYSLVIRTSSPGTSSRLEVPATYIISFGSYLYFPLILLQPIHELNLLSIRVGISRPGIRTNYSSLIYEILYP